MKKTELTIDAPTGRRTLFYGVVDTVFIITDKQADGAKWHLVLYHGGARLARFSYSFYPYTLIEQFNSDIQLNSLTVEAASLEELQALMDQNLSYGKK